MSTNVEIGSLSFGLHTDVHVGTLTASLDWVPVVISVPMSLVGSYSFVMLLGQTASVKPLSALLAGVLYGICCVWSLHFLGDSARLFDTCVLLRYDLLIVALSGVWPGLAAMLAYYLQVRMKQIQWHHHHNEDKSHKARLRPWSSKRMMLLWFLSTLSVTLGIALMHYTGLYAVSGIEAAQTLSTVSLVVLSAVSLNACAMALCNIADGLSTQTLASFFMTLGVAVPHYISMSGLRYTPSDEGRYRTCQRESETIDSIAGVLGINWREDERPAWLIVILANFTLFTVLGCYYFIKTLYRNRVLKQKADLQEVQRAFNSWHKLTFPMVVMRASKFLALDRLPYHEEARDAGLLTFLDSVKAAKDKRIVLYSHQWHGFSSADPHGSLFAAMRHATEELLAMDGSSCREELYIWVDTFSIPQALGMEAIQKAIDSLATFCSLASAFVAITPSAVHADLDLTCDLNSYMNRCWCRLEQASYLLSHGATDFYIAGDGPMVRLEISSIPQEAFFVFEGELTCCRLRHRKGMTCDRRRLIYPMLNLYRQLSETTVEGMASVRDFVLENKERMFPGDCIMNVEGAKSELTLFGDLLLAVDKHLQSDALRKSTNSGNLPERVAQSTSAPVLPHQASEEQSSSGTTICLSLEESDDDGQWEGLEAAKVCLPCADDTQSTGCMVVSSQDDTFVYGV